MTSPTPSSVGAQPAVAQNTGSQSSTPTIPVL